MYTQNRRIYTHTQTGGWQTRYTPKYTHTHTNAFSRAQVEKTPSARFFLSDSVYQPAKSQSTIWR